MHGLAVAAGAQQELFHPAHRATLSCPRMAAAKA
jgi:hypothetical protein